MGKDSLLEFHRLANEIQAAETATQAMELARKVPHSENRDRITISLMKELLLLNWEQLPMF